MKIINYIQSASGTYLWKTEVSEGYGPWRLIQCMMFGHDSWLEKSGGSPYYEIWICSRCKRFERRELLSGPQQPFDRDPRD